MKKLLLVMLASVLAFSFMSCDPALTDGTETPYELQGIWQPQAAGFPASPAVNFENMVLTANQLTVFQNNGMYAITYKTDMSVNEIPGNAAIFYNTLEAAFKNIPSTAWMDAFGTSSASIIYTYNNSTGVWGAGSGFTGLATAIYSASQYLSSATLSAPVRVYDLIFDTVNSALSNTFGITGLGDDLKTLWYPNYNPGGSYLQGNGIGSIATTYLDTIASSLLSVTNSLELSLLDLTNGEEIITYEILYAPTPVNPLTGPVYTGANYFIMNYEFADDQEWRNWTFLPRIGQYNRL